MDSKTKHRLLGVLVVIGLVVILLPFFQSNKDFSKEAKVVTAPPFPDQSVQVSMMNEDAGEVEEQAISIPPNTFAQSEEVQQPDDTINVIHPSVDHATAMEEQVTTKVVETKVAEAKAAEPNIAPTKGAEKKAAEIKVVEPRPVESATTPIAKSLVLKQNAKVASKTNPVSKKAIPQLPLDDDGLIKLKSAAWVIQLGSFSKKENALRLVNQLRANGYRAFIQQVSTQLGNTTRVFVGPELKHDQARALAIQLESDLHLHGMIISYKPLTL